MMKLVVQKFFFTLFFLVQLWTRTSLSKAARMRTTHTRSLLNDSDLPLLITCSAKTIQLTPFSSATHLGFTQFLSRTNVLSFKLFSLWKEKARTLYWSGTEVLKLSWNKIRREKLLLNMIWVGSWETLICLQSWLYGWRWDRVAD